MGGRFALAILGTVLLVTDGRAQFLYSDGFEAYNIGALDANLAGGANQAPNGGPGNPWFGPAPPNAQVVASGDGGVTAHGGGKMIRGNIAGSDFDQNWYNLANRLNSGSNFTGNVAMKWWFYDPLGPGGSNFRDYAALGNYTSAATAAASGLDYPTASNGNLNPGGASQRLSLGASNPAGFDATVYQARVAGATDGLASGWFNLAVPRTVGWHFAEILLGTDQGAATNVSFFIDDPNNAALTHAIQTTGGVNVMEFNSAFGPTTGYFDDVSFGVAPVPEPSTLLLTAGGLLAVWRRARRAG